MAVGAFVLVVVLMFCEEQQTSAVHPHVRGPCRAAVLAHCPGSISPGKQDVQLGHSGVVGGGCLRDHRREVGVHALVCVSDVHYLYRSGGGEGRDGRTWTVPLFF